MCCHWHGVIRLGTARPSRSQEDSDTNTGPADTHIHNSFKINALCYPNLSSNDPPANINAVRYPNLSPANPPAKISVQRYPNLSSSNPLANLNALRYSNLSSNNLWRRILEHRIQPECGHWHVWEPASRGGGGLRE